MGRLIKAYVFDVYGTLFDVYSVKEKCQSIFPHKGEAISQTWRQKQIEYSFLRQLMGTYRPFHEVTEDALRYAILLHGGEPKESVISELMDAYLHLTPYEEVKDVLQQLTDKHRAVFSNGSPSMLTPLLQSAEMNELFTSVITVDENKQYKPTKAAYQSVVETLNVAKEEVLFMSSNGWDITGAKQFGFQTAWINRASLPPEQLGVKPDFEFHDLTGLLSIEAKSV